MQRNYVGDGDGAYRLAGLGSPPIALTDGSKPGAESLFKHGLHEVNALFESQQYLKAPSSSDIVAARQQSMILDGIAFDVNGRPSNTASTTTSATSITNSNTSAENSLANSNNNETPSPTSGATTDSEKRKKISPAVAMQKLHCYHNKLP